MSRSVDYVFLLPGNTFNRQFINSWSNTIAGLESLGLTYSWFLDYTPLTTLTRNRLLGYADRGTITDKLSTVPFQGTLECKKVIFIDGDMVWSFNDIYQLITDPEPVVGAAYVMADKYSIAALQDSKTLNIHDLNGEMIPVTSMGLGLVACDFEVIKKLKYPWFSVIENEDGTRITEDVYFFNKVREVGYTPYLNSNIRVGHSKDVVLDTWGDK